MLGVGHRIWIRMPRLGALYDGTNAEAGCILFMVIGFTAALENGMGIFLEDGAIIGVRGEDWMGSLIFRTAFLYLVLIGVMRVLGKRQLGQMEASEVVVTMLAADLAATAMQDSTTPLPAALIPIFTVLATEFSLAILSLHSIRFRKLLCGKPVILIENGRILQKNLRKTRVTLDELLSQLRGKDVLDPSTVQYAILETGGELSVFPYPREKPASAKAAGISVEKQYIPITVVSDGKVLSENLRVAGKDLRWLQKTLVQNKVTLVQTFLLTVDGENRVNLCKREQ